MVTPKSPIPPKEVTVTLAISPDIAWGNLRFKESRLQFWTIFSNVLAGDSDESILSNYENCTKDHLTVLRVIAGGYKEYINQQTLATLERLGGEFPIKEREDSEKLVNAMYVGYEQAVREFHKAIDKEIKALRGES